MKSLSINDNNDIFVGTDGNIAISTGAPAILQNTRTAMQAQRGEMQYAIDDGMPTRLTAFDGFNPTQFEAAARAVIGAVAGVNAVNEFEAVNNAGTVEYSAVISTTEGVLNV